MLSSVPATSSCELDLLACLSACLCCGVFCFCSLLPRCRRSVGRRRAQSLHSFSSPPPPRLVPQVTATHSLPVACRFANIENCESLPTRPQVLPRKFGEKSLWPLDDSNYQVTIQCSLTAHNRRGLLQLLNHSNLAFLPPSFLPSCTASAWPVFCGTIIQLNSPVSSPLWSGGDGAAGAVLHTAGAGQGERARVSH